MILIDGKKEAASLRQKLKDEVTELKKKFNNVPGLTVILNTTNRVIACKKVSGVFVPVIRRKIMNNVHFESQM